MQEKLIAVAVYTAYILKQVLSGRNWISVRLVSEEDKSIYF